MLDKDFLRDLALVFRVFGSSGSQRTACHPVDAYAERLVESVGTMNAKAVAAKK